MPGKRCTVATCNNSHQKTKNRVPKVSYHDFPKDTVLRQQWVDLCGRVGKWNPKSCHICSDHFKLDDYESNFRAELMNEKERKVLKPNVVPSQKLMVASDDSSDEPLEDEQTHQIDKSTSIKKKNEQHTSFTSIYLLDFAPLDEPSIENPPLPNQIPTVVCENCVYLNKTNEDYMKENKHLRLELEKMQAKTEIYKNNIIFKAKKIHIRTAAVRRLKKQKDLETDIIRKAKEVSKYLAKD